MKPCLLLACLAVLSLTGCMTPARRLDPAVTASVQVGQTRAEVEKILGKPETLETGGNGRTLAVYSHGTGALAHGSQGLELRLVSLIYSPAFRLEKRLLHESQVTYTSRFFKPDEFGRLLPREEIVAKMKPVMSREEVIAEFGPPFVETLTVDGGSRLVWWAGRQKFSLWVQTYDTQSFVVTCNELGIVTDYRVLGQAEGDNLPAP